jgi:hypothetical protein
LEIHPAQAQILVLVFVLQELFVSEACSAQIDADNVGIRIRICNVCGLVGPTSGDQDIEMSYSIPVWPVSRV